MWLDPGEVASGLFVQDPFAGATKEGLGIGATMRCFIDVLGPPESSEVEDVDGKLAVSELRFGDYTILVDDTFAGNDLGQDGIVDSIGIFGPLQ